MLREVTLQINSRFISDHYTDEELINPHENDEKNKDGSYAIYLSLA